MDFEIKVKTAPDCPHCGLKMKKCENPPFNYSDGLGWCAPFFYVCFNDECNFFVAGWEHMRENYGKNASYRCMCYPDTGEIDSMAVFSTQAMRGQIIEEE